MKSAFTAEEIADAFRFFDVEAHVENDPDTDEPMFISVTINDIEFDVILPMGGPFFEEVSFMAFAPTEDDPDEWASTWNEEFRWSFATSLPRDESDPLDTGESAVSIVRRVGFYGGVHPDHLKSAAGQFLLDVLVMYGYEFDDETEDQDEFDDEVDESKIREAIIDALKSSSPQSAKMIAQAVGVPKTEINPILYSRPDLFRRKQGDPPEWSLKD